MVLGEPVALGGVGRRQAQRLVFVSQEGQHAHFENLEEADRLPEEHKEKRAWLSISWLVFSECLPTSASWKMVKVSSSLEQESLGLGLRHCFPDLMGLPWAMQERLGMCVWMSQRNNFIGLLL